MDKSAPAALNEQLEIPMTRGELRKLLHELLLSSTDLDSLCLDYFPSVYQRFSADMEFKRKVNLLFEDTEPAEILSGLREAFPAKFGRRFVPEGQPKEGEDYE